MIDQAGKLRTMVRKEDPLPEKTLKQPRIYSILSGKGGVGKTSITVNMGIALARLGNRVLILDADVGMGNVNILLGEVVRNDVMDVLAGRKTFREIVVTSPYGVDILMGGAELFGLETLDQDQHAGLLHSLSVLEEYDAILIDNGAGIHKHSLAYTILGDETILVTTPEPTAITDAYRVLKIISLYKLKSSVKVIVNQVQSEDAGQETFQKLYATSDRFLKLKLEHVGNVFSDVRVNRAVMEQVPFVVSRPHCLAGQGIQTIAGGLLSGQTSSTGANALARIGNRILRIFG